MDVSILEVKVYMYPKCPFYLKKTFNHLIYIYFHIATCSSLRKKLQTRRMLRFRYAMLILLKRF